MGNQWPEGVPSDYEAMFRKYGGIIANEIRKHNIVQNHFEDHYQTVCEKLISAQVLPRFVQRVNSSTYDDLPETMAALDVCVLFGLSFGAWRSKLWSFHKVFVQDLKRKVPVRGETHGTVKRNGKDISWVSWMPTPISGGYGSPKAVFKTSEVLEVPALGYFRNMKFDTARWPQRKVQPHHFQAYMLRAVRNHFSNACRTIMRRHKDRPGDCFSQFKNPDGEYNQNWEDGLPDPKSQGAFQAVEAAFDLGRTLVDEDVSFDRACMMTSEQKGEISSLLQSHTIIEAVKMSASLTLDQKHQLLSIAEG